MDVVSYMIMNSSLVAGGFALGFVFAIVLIKNSQRKEKERTKQTQQNG